MSGLPAADASTRAGWHSSARVSTIAASTAPAIPAPYCKTLKLIVINRSTTLVAAAIVCIAGIAAAPDAGAEGNAERGKPLAYTCFGCHGIEGYRNAYPSYRVPKLGGQKAAYIAVALKDYRDGNRSHPTMHAQASSFTDQQIEDIAAYMATLGATTVENGGTQGASLDAAKTCAACHGQNGIAVSPNWPTLAGQYEDYLVTALHRYRDGERTNAVMQPIAAQLSDADITQLARYFSGLEGLETPHPN